MRAPSISRGAATTSDVVRGPCEVPRGADSCRRATVSNGGQRAVEEKVEKRDLEIGGDPRAPSHTPRLRRFLARPTVHLPSGRACPVFRLFPPPPLDPPPPVARSTTKPCSPRPLHPRPRRPLQFQAVAARPASAPVAKADVKLKPPIGPSRSRSSPTMKRPGTLRDASVAGSTSSRTMPPPG